MIDRSRWLKLKSYLSERDSLDSYSAGEERSEVGRNNFICRLGVCMSKRRYLTDDEVESVKEDSSRLYEDHDEGGQRFNEQYLVVLDRLKVDLKDTITPKRRKRPAYFPQNEDRVSKKRMDEYYSALSSWKECENKYLSDILGANSSVSEYQGKFI